MSFSPSFCRRQIGNSSRRTSRTKRNEGLSNVFEETKCVDIVTNMYEYYYIHMFQEIRIISTGPCIANQLRYVNTICRTSWYIAAYIWNIYDFKIEVIPFIINFITELTIVVKFEDKSKNDADEAVSVVS